MLISISVVFLRTIADNIVQMAVNIEIAETFQIFQNRFKIFAVGFFLRPSLVKSGIIGVFSIAEMGRGDDEVIFVRFGKGGIFFREVWL